jgi:protoporphyrinogen oxidase
MIDTFFRPWLGGIFLDSSLATSSRMMYFVLRMMAGGDVSVPAGGMEEIPRQLAAQLPPDRVRCNTPVAAADAGSVTLASGEAIRCGRVVLAAASPRLSGRDLSASHDWRPVTTVYFAAAKSPVKGGWLVLNGTPGGMVNNLAVMSEVSRAYAPKGDALVSVTVLDPRGLEGDALTAAVLGELEGWYGAGVRRWRHLRTCEITRALPAQTPGFRERAARRHRDESGILHCGDHTAYGSLNGAMASGRKTARRITAELETGIVR